MTTKNIERYRSQLLRQLFALTIVLLGSASCSGAMSIPSGEGLTIEQRQKVKDFITQARQDAREIFNDPARREVQKQRLMSKIEELAVAAKNNALDSKLVSNAREWIEKTYQATIQGLTPDEKAKLNEVISLQAKKIFPQELVLHVQEHLPELEARATKLRTKINEFAQKAKTSEEKDIVNQAREVINRAYEKVRQELTKKTSQGAAARLNPAGAEGSAAVTALIETSAVEMPPMEDPGFDAPPLESATKVPAPTATSTVTTSSQWLGKPTRATNFSGRDDLLADIRKGQKLKPVAQRTLPAAPSTAPTQAQKPSMMDDLKQRMAARRAMIGEE